MPKSTPTYLESRMSGRPHRATLWTSVPCTSPINSRRLGVSNVKHSPISTSAPVAIVALASSSGGFGTPGRASRGDRWMMTGRNSRLRLVELDTAGANAPRRDARRRAQARASTMSCVMKRRVRFAGKAGASIGLLVALFWLVPYSLTAVSEWQARWFASELVAGMSHRQVDDLRKDAGGSAAGRIVDDAPSTAHVWFVPSIRPCYVKGRVFSLRFDRHDRLTHWQTDTWGDGC